jgi:DNA-binding ferritin-like protein (Dps family)
VPGAKGLKGSVDDGRNSVAVEAFRHLDADLSRASGTLGAGVEVTEGAAAHGRGLAMESAGHDVATFVDHKILSCG